MGSKAREQLDRNEERKSKEKGQRKKVTEPEARPVDPYMVVLRVPADYCHHCVG